MEVNLIHCYDLYKKNVYSRNVTIIFYSINISRTTVVKYKAYIEYYIYTFSCWYTVYVLHAAFFFFIHNQAGLMSSTGPKVTRGSFVGIKMSPSLITQW